MTILLMFSENYIKIHILLSNLLSISKRIKDRKEN